MAEILHRYLQYRRVGFGRIAALHFAWLVSVRTRPAIARLPGR